MKQKKPLSDRENEAFSRLRIMMPEYEIHPNMRLADIIETPPNMFNEISRYHLDFVIWDNDRKIIAAIELDDQTHDNQKAKIRDEKKDKWLNQAKIKLIRIRNLNEISSIKSKIREYEFEELPQNPNLSLPCIASRTKNKIQNYLLRVAMTIIVVTGLAFVANAVLKKTLAKMGENLVTKQTQMQKDLQQRATHQQQSKQAISPKIQAKTEPQYQKVFVKGKSAQECKNSDGVLDNKAMWCMNDHYEKMLISDNQ